MGIVSDPVPHLYIISDEFAELKSQQPEFMDELISTARIGRSLGVHLILSTQKPAGVVDEQIWSNTKFRVCLKVQDKQDSMDMIRRPEAAELVNPGRFYFQVGYNELFAMGQSAWSGAEYIPKEVVDNGSSNTIKLINNVGNVELTSKLNTNTVTDTKYSQQVVEIVKHLSDIAEKEGIEPLSLWMEPLPSSILISKLVDKYQYKVNPAELNPIIGEYDDPATQSQHLLTMPITRDGNCAIYGSVGSGKTTLLSTIIYSMINNVSAEHVNMYIIDFGTGSLKVFEKAPQVGDVLLQEDTEKIGNLIKMIDKEIIIRKKKFAQYGGDISNYRKFSKEPIANILIFINNYDVFVDEYDVFSEKIKTLLRDGLKYGISFILTTTSTNVVNFNYIQNIKLIYSLQMNSPDDYSYILGKTDGLVPSSVPGRGLVKIQDNIYEFQTALLEYSDKMMSTIVENCEKLSSESKVFAEPIPVLPDKVNYSFFKNKVTNLNKFPVGVDKEDLYIRYLNLKGSSCKFIFAEIIKNTNSYIKELVKMIAKVPGAYPFVFDIGNKLKIQNSNKIYVATNNNFTTRLNYVYNEYKKRVQTIESSSGNPAALDKSFDMVCILYGYAGMLEQLTTEQKMQLDELMSINQAQYKISIIVVDDASSIGNYNIESWYTKSIVESPITWIGRGIGDQFSVRVNGNPNNDITTEFGYIIEDGVPLLTKVLSYEEEKVETLEV